MMSWDIGVDEAGRGPLAGPVCAAAVSLTGVSQDWGLADSKRLSARRRTILEPQIQCGAAAFGIGWASVDEIDQHNILVATCMAMSRAVRSCQLVICRDHDAAAQLRVQVDGSIHPGRYVVPEDWPWETQTHIGGDGFVDAISAASILAKVARDRLMNRLDQEHPGYGFAQHLGYGTKAHLQALREHGPSPIHRRTFRPVSEWRQA